MKVTAERQVYIKASNIRAVPGDSFELNEEVATPLIQAGILRKFEPPRVAYETRMIVPAEAPEVGPRPPFRHVPMPDPEPEGVASEGDSVLPETVVPPPGADDPGGRAGRARSAARR